MTSSVDTERLIEEVKLRPAVWSSESESYIRTAAWKEISQVLGVRVPLLKLKWKNIRDCFRREYVKSSIVKRRPLKSVNDYTGKWRYFKQLWDVFKSVRQSTSTSIDAKLQIEQDESSAVEEKQYESDEEIEETVDGRKNPLEESKETGDTVYKLELFEDDNDINEHLAEERVFVEEFIPENTRELDPRRDYDSMYLNSLLPFFKMLSPVRKLCVRNQIQELLIKELRTSGNRN